VDLRTKLKDTASRTLGLSSTHLPASNEAVGPPEASQSAAPHPIVRGYPWTAARTRLAA
jgi:hypothetical protein